MEVGKNWFLSWIAKDLLEFQNFLHFINGCENDLRIFLDEVKEKIVELGHVRGFHSRSTYEKLNSQ